MTRVLLIIQRKYKASAGAQTHGGLIWFSYATMADVSEAKALFCLHVGLQGSIRAKPLPVAHSPMVAHSAAYAIEL